MSRKSSQRKRTRQRERFEQRPRELAAPVSAITGEEQAVFQTPTRSDIRKISTEMLLRELLNRKDSRGLIAAIAETNANSL